jgi:hypothetical protein
VSHARLGLLAGLVACVVFGVWALALRGGSDSTGVSSMGSGDYAYPAETLEDALTYADQVSVATVTGERRLPTGTEEESGGLLGRSVALRVDRTIWRLPGAKRAPGTMEFVSWGWMKSYDNPIAAEGGARLEVGKRYLLALTHGIEEGKNEWWAYSDTTQFLLDGDTVSGEFVGQSRSEALRAVTGMTVAEVAALLNRMEIDPLALKYARLGARKRWQAIGRERG